MLLDFDTKEWVHTSSCFSEHRELENKFLSTNSNIDNIITKEYRHKFCTTHKYKSSNATSFKVVPNMLKIYNN